MAYSQYIPKHERPVITALFKAVLADGNTISVFDSCEYVLKRSSSLRALQAAVGHAGEDQLVIRDQAGKQIGWFWLIYNNGSEGDPMIVICDYTANEYCESIYSPIYAKYS